jgi:hypothetical protein
MMLCVKTDPQIRLQRRPWGQNYSKAIIFSCLTKNLCLLSFLLAEESGEHSNSQVKIKIHHSVRNQSARVKAALRELTNLKTFVTN